MYDSTYDKHPQYVAYGLIAQIYKLCDAPEWSGSPWNTEIGLILNLEQCFRKLLQMWQGFDMKEVGCVWTYFFLMLWSETNDMLNVCKWKQTLCWLEKGISICYNAYCTAAQNQSVTLSIE